MTARIARGVPTGARRSPARTAAGGARKRRGKGKGKAPGLLDGLPVSAATARRLGLWGSATALAVVALAAAFALQLPQRLGTALGEQIGAAGFTVKRVELRGLDHIDPSALTKTALDQPSLAMPLVDLDAIRDRLLAEYRWIREARVHRRLPDTLVVEVEERVPAAVWQHNRQLQLVDREGVALERLRAEALPDLPLVIGPGAQHQIAGWNALIEAAPQLRPQLAGGSWIGGRRWDLRFRSGETLSLPEGEGPAAAALRRFADMTARQRLLGGNFLRFDMRIEGRMIVQLKRPPNGSAPAAPAVPAPGAGEPPHDLSRTI